METADATPVVEATVTSLPSVKVPSPKKLYAFCAAVIISTAAVAIFAATSAKDAEQDATVDEDALVQELNADLTEA